MNCLFKSFAIISFGLFALFSSICKSPLYNIDGNPLSSALQIFFSKFIIYLVDLLVASFMWPNVNIFM